MVKETGGPAFPVNEQQARTVMGRTTMEYPHIPRSDGMTLRDYFAATVGSDDLASINVKKDREALAGRPEPDVMLKGIDGIKFNMEVEAALRYLYADAMLAERNK